MSKKAKLILTVLLVVGNAYWLVCWIQEAAGANDVARQWMRIIFPCVMIVQSIAAVICVWLTDKILRLRKRNTKQ